jgi:hypothetical protein
MNMLIQMMMEANGKVHANNTKKCCF